MALAAQFSIVLELARAALRCEARAGGEGVRLATARLRNALLRDAEAEADQAQRMRGIAVSALLDLNPKGNGNAIPDGFSRETWRKRRGNAVFRLYDAGKISELEMRAAIEIQNIAAQGLSSAALRTIAYDEPRIDNHAGSAWGQETTSTTAASSSASLPGAAPSRPRAGRLMASSRSSSMASRCTRPSAATRCATDR